jgi:hypothetical protein
MQRNAACLPRMAFVLGILRPFVHMVARLGARRYTKVYTAMGPNGPSTYWRLSGPSVWEEIACKNRVCETTLMAPTNSA